MRSRGMWGMGGEPFGGRTPSPVHRKVTGGGPPKCRAPQPLLLACGALAVARRTHTTTCAAEQSRGGRATSSRSNTGRSDSTGLGTSWDMPLAPSEASDWAVLGLTSSRQGTTCGEGVLRTKQVPHFVDLRSKGNSKPGGFFGGRARKPMGADADEVLRRPPQWILAKLFN